MNGAVLGALTYCAYMTITLGVSIFRVAAFLYASETTSKEVLEKTSDFEPFPSSQF